MVSQHQGCCRRSDYSRLIEQLKSTEAAEEEIQSTMNTSWKLFPNPAAEFGVTLRSRKVSINHPQSEHPRLLQASTSEASDRVRRSRWQRQQRMKGSGERGNRHGCVIWCLDAVKPLWHGLDGNLFVVPFVLADWWKVLSV